MSEQIPAAASRAARAILEWSAKDLCKAARVSATVVSKVEREIEVSTDQNQRIVEAFAEAGIELLGGGKPGARLGHPN